MLIESSTGAVIGGEQYDGGVYRGDVSGDGILMVRV